MTEQWIVRATPEGKFGANWKSIWTESRQPVVTVDSFMRRANGEDECYHGVNISEANAALIAAAPALLAAAEAAMDYMPGGYQSSRCHAGLMTQQECNTCKAKAALRAAISQARGEA